MRFLILIMLSSTTLFACKKDDKKTSSSTTPTTQEGSANITLNLNNGEVFQLSGPCGWATAMGTHYIGANHSTNNLRVFETVFNLEELPDVTTTYTLVDSQFDEDPTHIYMNITEIIGSSYIEWTSHDASGTLTLVVNGNTVTADLSGILLESGSSNAAPFNANGTLSGTLTLYK